MRTPSDLLPPASTTSVAPRPAWVDAPLSPSGDIWAVVRRDSGTPLVPVGLRGADRGDRWAAVVDPDAIVDVIRPWQVRVRARHGRTALPAFAALDRVRDVLANDGPNQWGPGGSVAYELVTGIDTVRLGSDLDLVLVAAEPLDRDRMRQVAERLNTARREVRIDLQVQTPEGGFALEEWLRVGDGGRVALKTNDGPRLTMDPWAVGA